MKNPGLDAFSAATTFAERPPTHPIWDDIREGDPDYDPEHDDNPSDYVPPKEFHRWQTPGQTRIPTIVGPKFHSEEMPDDIIHGEISPEEQDSADRILNGEHESDSPSDNPDVEKARQTLRKPGSDIAVETLSGLLRGGSPSDVGDLDEAHDFLRQHFDAVRVNPHHGTMVVHSPAGSQMVKRQAPQPPATKPTFSLANKHGVFESEDVKRLVRTMMAFQIISNTISEKKRKDEEYRREQQANGGMTSTSAAQSNDLCPVCVSGYLEPYDSTYHECLNCGSLVKHIGFEKAAARPKGGLGRGLKQIQEYEGNPMGLGTVRPEKTDEELAEETPVQPHITVTQENQNPDTVYQAPTELREKGQVRRKQAMAGTDAFRAKFFQVWPNNLTAEAAEAGVDPLDEHMGKLGFRPLHRPGQSRAYVADLPGNRGVYARLSEGVPHPQTGKRGWALSVDHFTPPDRWTSDGELYGDRKLNMDRLVRKPDSPKFRQPLPDLGDRAMTGSLSTTLATGHHPIEDAALNRAIRDLTENGRNSETYQSVLGTAYEPPARPAPDAPGTPYSNKGQQRLRGLSSVSNPGLDRFVT